MSPRIPVSYFRTLAGALVAALLVAVTAGPAPGAGPGTVSVDSLRAHPELDPDSGYELLGKPAREFRFARWLRTAPLTPEVLRGKVVLIRFWTDECRYCRNTLPAVEDLRRRYGSRGFIALGAYHPNEPGPVKDATVLQWADSLGFRGPIAVDENWDTLRRWWLDGHPDRNWVSVSFLLDRDGVVRWVHGGGEYHPSSDPRHHACDVSYAKLDREIETLLAR
jgi:hypothetical protein